MINYLYKNLLSLEHKFIKIINYIFKLFKKVNYFKVNLKKYLLFYVLLLIFQ